MLSLRPYVTSASVDPLYGKSDDVQAGATLPDDRRRVSAYGRGAMVEADPLCYTLGCASTARSETSFPRNERSNDQ